MTDHIHIFWGFLALSTWGVADYLAKASTARIGSISTAVLVQAIGVAVPVGYLAVLLAAGGTGVDTDWVRLAYLAPLTALFLTAAYAAYYTGLQVGSASVVSSVASAWLLVSVAIAAVVFGERIGLYEGLLTGVIMVGIWTISIRRCGLARGDGAGYGLLAMLGIGIAFAMWKPLTDAAGPVLAVVVVRGTTAAMLFAFLRVKGESPRLPAAGRGLWLLLAASVLDASGFVAYNIGIERGPLSVVASLAAAHSIVTIALAMLLLRERSTRLQAGGMAITIAGVIALSAASGA